MEFTERDFKKKQNAGLFYLCLALIVALASGVLVYKLIQNIVAACCVGIGMFLFFFFMMNVYTVWKVKRKGTHVWATVTRCEIFPLPENTRTTPLYQVTYEIPNQRAETFVKQFSEKPLEIGAMVGGYYISETDGLVTDEKIREISSNRSLKRFMVGCFAVAIIVGAISVLTR